MSDAGTKLTVNGRVHTVEADPETPLLYVLRNDLGLKGARPGCGIGVCGACVVLADGEPIRSCSTPLSAVTDTDVTTPEGLGRADNPHLMQEAFLAEQAAQCGYCINGIIMSAAAAAERGETPGPEVPGWLAEHLCRCGTHHRVLRAIRRGSSGEHVAPAAAPDGRPAGVGAAWSLGMAPPADEAPLRKERVESWVRLLPDGRIEARLGRVELGQGIVTAMAQIVAGQVGVPLDCVVVRPAVTGVAPDDAFTVGSNSVDEGGTALGRAAAAFRRLLLERAGQALGQPPSDLAVAADRIDAPNGKGVPLADLAAAGPITGDIEPTDQPDWSAAPLGQPVHRDDLRPKLTGSPAYAHDLELPGMLHARALLPPNPQSTLEHLDVAAAEEIPGVVRVIADDRLVIVVAEREETAVRAVRRLQGSARWTVPESEIDSGNVFEALRTLAADRYVARQTATGPPPEENLHTATYSQPYQAHAAISPSCAVAEDTGDLLRVWTHSQGIYPLRGSLAALLGESDLRIQVLHVDGPGCYGHNLADDAAAFAAVAARALPGWPIRLQFSVEDEFTWEPLGPAMLADLAAAVGPDGRIRYWSHHTLTDTHVARPNGSADRLVPGWLRADRGDFVWPGAHEGGGRNAAPPYDIAAVEAVADHVRGPLRTGSLRTLGAYLNTFATESFMDELAEQAGADALEFRLAHLSDERARRVLQTAAEAAGWSPHVGPSGRGLGLAVSRYKDVKAYVAQAIQASIDPETAAITVHRVITACDAGVVLNPDGIRNQLEGGTLQGLSRALYEEVRFDRRGVVTRDWLDYPVLGFSDVPDLDVILVDSTNPPLGVGEAALGPAAAALANAVDDASGIRLRALPFRPERTLQLLYDMDEDEAARVLSG